MNLHSINSDIGNMCEADMDDLDGMMDTASVDIRPIYKHQGHTQKAFDVLNLLKKQKFLCDVILQVDGIEIPAHKAILAACSQYFYAMFTNELVESKAHCVSLQEIDGKALQQLIDFMYTSEIIVTEENVQTLLPAAKILQLSEVSDACCEFLQAQLHPSNCLGILEFADLHSCSDLVQYAQTFTEQNFSEVTKYEEFFNLSVLHVTKLITSEKLTVPTEEFVFDAVLNWINHDRKNREIYVSKLLECVRLCLLPQTTLIEKVEQDSLIRSNSECKDYLIEAMKFHLLSPEQKTTFSTPRAIPRSPVGLPKLLLVIGGQAPKAIRSVECYDFKSNKWYQVADMQHRRCRCGVAVMNGNVYTVGGFNGSLRVRTVDKYDAKRDMWQAVSSMEARRSTLGAAILNGQIFAVGGFDGSSGLNSVECYDPLQDCWRTVCSMSTRRSSVGVGVVNGYLYAIGGYDGASRHCLSSVECYNVTNNTWSEVCEMTCRRSGAGVGVVDGLLYAVGGHDGPLVRKSVEAYDPSCNSWKQVADMHMCRRNAGVVAHNGMLYVVGGDDGSSNLASVEFYNPKDDIWTMLNSNMNHGRSYAGVCVIEKPL